MPVSAEEVRRRIRVDPDTGALFWRSDPPKGRLVGDRLPFRDNGNGYLYSTVNRRGYGVHRLVWAALRGVWPVEVDHIDGDKSNNRPANLREASRSQNECNKTVKSNNTSGYKGVGWHKCKDRWRAYIQIDGRQISLGYHDTPELAHRAYCGAASKLHGEFARFT